MKALENIWNGTTASEHAVINSAMIINQLLPTQDHVQVIKFTDNWFIIAGNAKAKEVYDKMVKRAKEMTVE